MNPSTTDKESPQESIVEVETPTEADFDEQNSAQKKGEQEQGKEGQNQAPQELRVLIHMRGYSSRSPGADKKHVSTLLSSCLQKISC